jgi:hypothetical protein
MNDYREKLDTKTNKIIAATSCLQTKYRPADQENAIRLNSHHVPFHLQTGIPYRMISSTN